MQREGTALMRENLRRRHPTATDAEIAALLDQVLEFAAAREDVSGVTGTSGRRQGVFERRWMSGPVK